MITDFTGGADVLILTGSASDYSIGAHTVAGVTGTGLFLETGTTDELIAIIQGTGVSSSNVIEDASFV